MDNRSIVVDMLRSDNPEIQLRQRDKGIPIAFYVYEGGKGIDLGEWDTCTLDVQDEDGTLVTQVHCEIGEDAVTCKVSPLMTEDAGELWGRLVLENEDARMSSGDISIIVTGSRKSAPDPVMPVASIEEQGAYEKARRAFEDAKDLLDGLMVEAERSKGNYDGARKLLEEATKTYGIATKARDEGMKILGKAVADLQDAKGLLKERAVESSTAKLLMQKATEDKAAAEKAYKQAVESLAKQAEELRQYKAQDEAKVAPEAPEAALKALAVASNARTAVDELSAAVDELKATVVSLAMRKEA